MKIKLPTVNQANSLSTINSNFEKLSQELQEKVLYRKNPTGEPNVLEQDIDVNGKNLYNVEELRADKLLINGRYVDTEKIEEGVEASVANAALALTRANAAAQSAYDSLQSKIAAEAAALNAAGSSTVNSRGAWTPSTAYAVKDLVKITVGAETTWYIALTAHTAGASFATDSAKWRVYQGVVAGDLAAATGAAGIGFLQSLGATPRTLESKNRDFINALDFGVVADWDGFTGTDNSAAISSTINYANGRKVRFPSGSILVTDTLALNVWKYAIEGEKSERGTNAGAGFANTTIVFRPVDTTKFFVSRFDATAPFGGVIGPFTHENIKFDFLNANGFEFGRESLGVVADGLVQKYVFGVRFRGCSITASGAVRASDLTGKIARSGKKMVHLTKCFESSLEGVSLYGGDTQVRTFGCDKPVMRGIRSQGSHLPFDLKSSGSFTVQHTVDDVQVEGWSFSPLSNQGNVLAVSNSRFELSSALAAGQGIVNLTTAYGYTAAVTAGSGTLVFSASMDEILFPGLSIIRLVSDSNDDYCLVTSVVGTAVGVSTQSFDFTWSGAGVTVYRVHGYGPVHSGAFGANFSNISPGAALNCPAFVYVAGRGAMHIANVEAQTGSYGDIRSLPIGNRFGADSSGYQHQQMAFSNCSPLVCADVQHPYVTVSNLRENNTYQEPIAGTRQRSGSLFEQASKASRVWAWSPKSYMTSASGLNVTAPFKRFAGDVNTGQSVYAWSLAGSVPMRILDTTLPSASRGMLKLRIRCRSVAATDTLVFVAQGNGGTVISNIAVTSDWSTVEWIGQVPSQWIGVRSAGAGLTLTTTNGVHIESVVLYDSGVSDADYSAGLTVVKNAAGSKDIATATTTVIAKVDLSDLSTGKTGSVRLAFNCGQVLPNAGYCSVYKDYALLFGNYSNTKTARGTPLVIATSPQSVASGTSALDVTITHAVVSGVLEISATLSATGTQPSTTARLSWTASIISSSNLSIAAA